MRYKDSTRIGQNMKIVRDYGIHLLKQILKQRYGSALTATWCSGVNVFASVKMASLCSSTKRNPTSKALVFHRILILQGLPSFQKQCSSDMTVTYMIFNLRFYDPHFWGKPPVYHMGSSRTMTLISLSCPLTVSIVWAHLCCCFAFPVLDLAEGSVKKLWVKPCVPAVVSIAWGPWLLSWRYF